jgi:hypothetical protein
VKLTNAGMVCDPDTIQPLASSGVVTQTGRVGCTAGAVQVLGACIVANQQLSAVDMWVDYPSAYVVTPFKEGWSVAVFK